MNALNSDKEWEKWGQSDPYFAVLTDEKFRYTNLTEDAKKEFFDSGRRHINHVIEVCRFHFDQSFSPKRVLDFGCGVGRTLIPLAKLAKHVVGVDISNSMLKTASNNCNEYDVRNISLLKSDDNLSSLDGDFDLIHSVLVFQHIPTKRGRLLFSNLLNHLTEGGICAIQFLYSKSIFINSYGVPPAEPPIREMRRKVARSLEYLRKILRLPMRGQKSNVRAQQDPIMLMNTYNLNELFFIIQLVGIHNLYAEFMDMKGEFSIFLYFKKPMKS